MATESATALSRSPTPTLPSNDTFDINSDNEAATNTDISSNSDDDEEEDYDDDIQYHHYYLNHAFWTDLITSLNAITNSSIDASVGISTTSLRKYYIKKLTELSNRPEYDISLTLPPCPHITIVAVDHEGQDDDAGLECPCCLPDDLPQLKIVAEDVIGGVVTYKVLLQRVATWLYGPDQEEPLGLGQESALGRTVEGLPAGEAGVVKFNFMTDSKDPETGVESIMGLKLFLYFAKPLVGGGRFMYVKEDGDDRMKLS
ncbi:uncharacterized protein DFL_001198 [Arthrobotrys flagrans]|uniref:Uncharacterized protein n=1 Tax=Arthrobotrys flagrans TaxID=97331 RepID=A0A437AGF4_ARTFL|nr:hypothetical protein DFL_001198 [Arthrobotrys flagrans]